MRRVLLMAIAVIAIACGEHDVSRQLGARCSDSDECDDRCLLASRLYPDGFCTVTCDSAADCPARSTCASDSGGVCVFTCEREADCAFLGAGWRCVDASRKPQGTVKVCRGI